MIGVNDASTTRRRRSAPTSTPSSAASRAPPRRAARAHHAARRHLGLRQDARGPRRGRAQQVRRIAAARRGGGDGRLVVVEGVPLLPLELFVEGLHPTTRGYAELARNLNAALGFSPVAVAVAACSPLVLRVRGLTPRGRYAIYHALDCGAAAGDVADECAGRAMMVPRGGREEGIADASGAATVTLAAARSTTPRRRSTCARARRAPSAAAPTRRRRSPRCCRRGRRRRRRRRRAPGCGGGRRRRRREGGTATEAHRS